MFKNFIKNDKGTVAIIGAVALPLMLGMVALVAEFGNGLATKIADQRVSDLAAVAGALAYNSSSSTATMTSVAENVAALNGVASGVNVSLVNSPSNDGNQAVLVKISSSNKLLLAQVLGFGSALPVTSSSYAEVTVQAAGCIVALNGAGTGVSLTGGTSVTAAGCSVASNASVSVPCGTAITTKVVAYNSSGPPSECETPPSIVPPSGTASVKFLKTVTVDPLAGNADVSSAVAHMTSVASLTSPSAPTVPSGGDISFAYNTTSTQAQAVADGCTANFSGNTWTLTCSGASTYKFGNITSGGGITVNFNTLGSASTTYDFSGSISNTGGGSTFNFGPGIYNIAQGITTGGGSTTTFGAGTFNIGPGSSSSGCYVGGTYSICNQGTSLTFGGPSTFVIAGGVYNTGGSTLTLGSGSTNSFQIGAGSNGDAFYAGGGSHATFADALGNNSLFSVAGNIDVASGGGSCLALSAASQHDINGNFSSAGGTVLGAGVYTINGYFALGAQGGGDVSCNGTSVGLTGEGVTLVISGIDAPPSGSCPGGPAFCVAAGYSGVVLTAPTSGATAGLVIIGPSANSAGATLGEGASGASLSGAVYFPHGPVTLTGGASLGGGSGQCLELIGSQVTLSGGTALASSCIEGGSSAASVVLVQ